MPSESDFFSRRDFLAGAGALAATTLLSPSRAAAASSPLGNSPLGDSPLGDSPLGDWIDDDFGLPAWHYTGPLRFPGSPVFENTPMLPDDPFFLTGNYRLTLFAHSSGALQVLTGERAWGRMNQGPIPFSGANTASVEIAGSKHALIGLDEPAAAAADKRFGIGFARYDYTLPSALAVTRLISVMPSTRVNEGVSAFLLQIRLRNTGQQPLGMHYEEAIAARYQQILAAWDEDRGAVAYSPDPAQQIGGSTAFVSFTLHPKRLLAFPTSGQMSHLEQFPPALFVHSADTQARPFAVKDPNGDTWLGTRWNGTLQPGQQQNLACIIGYTRDISAASIHNLAAQLQSASTREIALGSAFGDAWRAKIPAYVNEADLTLRREMRWNTAVLEQMAKWREYYDETIMPQGTDYDFKWGMVGSMRDQAQHALPLCHTNPAIARSTLRFIMKRTVPDGEIKLNDGGFGWSPSGPQQTSDQQLYFFMLLTEYLRVTGDASVLTETIGYYPLNCSGRDTGLAHVRQAFLYLRDRVGVGQHGIVKRWNSDWNDMFFWWPSNHPYNDVFPIAESHMNSAMAIVILGDLATQLDAHAPEAADVSAALREYRTQLSDAFMRDLGDRTFPRRAWTWTNTALGEQDMWLEPQGFTLLNPDFPADRKRRLYAELEQRLLAGESQGARQIEKPVVEPGTPQGSRENGGFWYALNGPLILGVSTFDQAAAESLLRRITFAHYAETFPNYWTGHWSGSDSLDSALLKTNGLAQMIPWCAHAHAWPLYCWLRLRELPRST